MIFEDMFHSAGQLQLHGITIASLPHIVRSQGYTTFFHAQLNERDIYHAHKGKNAIFLHLSTLQLQHLRVLFYK